MLRCENPKALIQQWAYDWTVRRCDNCDSDYLVLDAADGVYVCGDCGEVSTSHIYDNGHDLAPTGWTITHYNEALRRNFGHYKRIHHFHERVSQFQIQEPDIPTEAMEIIIDALANAAVPYLSKEVIRRILRPLGLQKYTERWLQIMFRLTGHRPPLLSSAERAEIDQLFVYIETGFSSTRPKWRKNFINYNYMLVNIMVMIGRPDCCHYFPPIKSKQKLEALNSMWKEIAAHMGRTYRPPPTYQEIKVHLL